MDILLEITGFKSAHCRYVSASQASTGGFRHVSSAIPIGVTPYVGTRMHGLFVIERMKVPVPEIPVMEDPDPTKGISKYC